MQSYHPVKFGGHRHCDGGNKTLLVVEEQKFTYYRFILPFICFILPSLKHMACHSFTHQISERKIAICQCVHELRAVLVIRV